MPIGLHALGVPHPNQQMLAVVVALEVVVVVGEVLLGVMGLALGEVEAAAPPGPKRPGRVTGHAPIATTSALLVGKYLACISHLDTHSLEADMDDTLCCWLNIM